MLRSANGLLRAASCIVLVCALGCGKTSSGTTTTNPPPPVIPSGLKLVVSPEGALLDAGGKSATFTVHAFDGTGAPFDAGKLDLEWVSSNVTQVTVQAASGTTATATAVTARGSAVISVRLKSDATQLSNPAQVLTATVQPGVQLIKDSQVVFPPPGDPSVLATNGLLPDISAPDAGGHVTIGGFADTDVVALYTTDRGLDGTSVNSIRKPLVLRGTPPAVGTVVFGAEGAKVAGKVISVRTQGTFSLIQLEQVGAPDVFDTVDYSFDQEPLAAANIVKRVIRRSTRQVSRDLLTNPPPDCKGDNSFNPPQGMVEATATLEGVGAFEYRASKTQVEHILFKAGVKATVGLDFKLTYQVSDKVSFECLLPPDFQTPPLSPPGPMAALVAFDVDIQPKLTASVKVTGGAGGTLKPKVQLEWPFVFGGSYDGGVATPIADFTPSFTADWGGLDGEIFTIDPTDFVDWKVETDVGGGITTTLGATLGGVVTQAIRDLAQYIPWIGSQVASITNIFYVKIVTVDTLLDLAGQWSSMGQVIADKSDTAGLALKAKVEGKFLPDILSGLNKLLGAHMPLQLKANISADVDIWSRGSLKMHGDDGTDTKIEAGTDQNKLAEKAPVLVKDGDTVFFKVTTATTADAATGGQVFRHDSATPQKLADLTGGAVMTGSWTVPDGFCGDSGETAITVPVVGFNKAFGFFPMSAYLGSVDISCSPLLFKANGSAISKDAPFTTTTVVCPSVDLELQGTGAIPQGATVKLTSHIDLGDISQDFDENDDNPPDIKKSQGLKAGTYTWTGRMEVTTAAGAALPAIEQTRQVVIGDCDVLVCHANGTRVKDGDSLSIDSGSCPPVSVAVDCIMPYASKDMHPRFTSSLNGVLSPNDGPPPVLADSVSLNAGNSIFVSTLSVDAFGGGTESIIVDATLTVAEADSCKGKKNAQSFPPAPQNSPTPGLGYGGCLNCAGPTPGGGGSGGDAWGDPHITTRAGASFTSYELGEFTYAEPHPAAGVTGGMTVQVRHQKLPGFQEWASFDTAAAVSVDGHVFEVRLPRDPNHPDTIDLSQRQLLETLIDGKVVHLNPQMYVMDNSLSFRVAATNGMEIYYQDPTLASAPANPLDAVSKVFIGTRSESNLLHTGGDPSEPVVALDVGMLTVGPYQGVLGRPDLDDTAQDFIDRDGVTHSTADTAFMTSWKTTKTTDPSKSLFTYQNGEGPETFDVPQSNTQPSGAALNPFIDQVAGILTDLCGLTPDQEAQVPDDFIASVALELAAGRSAHNMIESGLCQDGRVLPATQTALVAFTLTGSATLQDRPDLPVSGALVRIVAREPGRLLCQTTTLSDGSYGCALTDLADGYQGFDTIHLDYTFTGRGPLQTATEAISPPAPNGAITSVRHDFSAPVANLLSISGTITDPQSVPLGGALMRMTSPAIFEARADSSGAYSVLVALPDGVTHGVIAMAVFAADFSTTTTASQPFTLDGPGIHSIPLDIQTQALPGSLPPLPTLRRVLVTGKVTDQLAAQQDGSVVALGGVPVSVTSTAFSSGCEFVITQTDGSYQCTAILKDASAFTVKVGTQLPGPAATLTVTADQVPLLGDQLTLTQDLSVSPATLVLTGVVDTANGPIAGATVDVTASSGEAAHAVTASDGSYRAYLALKSAGEASPLLNYAISLGGAASSAASGGIAVQQGVNAPSGVLTSVVQNARFVTGTAVLTGRVVDALAQNAPVPGAGVAAVDSQGRVVCQAVTSSTGVYGCAVSTSGTSTAVFDLQVSQRGSATFPRAASVDQSLIAAGQLVPAPVDDLAVSVTTVQVSGIVRDSTGAAVPGATVGASAAGSDAASTTTGADGRYLLELPIDEGRTAGSVAVSVSFAAPAGALTAAAQLTWTGAAHTLIALTRDLTLNGAAQAGTSFARIAFSGKVLNTNAPGTTVSGARVQISFASGGSLCDVFAADDGTWSCHAITANAPAAPAGIVFKALLGGQGIFGPQTVNETFARGGAVESSIVQDLAAFPSTLTVHGQLTDSGGVPIGGAAVTVQGDLSGRTTTDDQGGYSITATASVLLHDANVTVVATINGVSVAQPLAVTMVPNGIADRLVNLTLIQRRIAFGGTVENALAAGSFLRDAQVTLSAGGKVFCVAGLQPTGTSTPSAFTCPSDLILTAANDIGVSVQVQNAFGSAGSTVSVTPPDGGARGSQQLKLSLAATAVTVSGTIHGVDGNVLASASISLDAAGATAQITSDATGHYSAVLTLPDALPQSGNGFAVQIAAIASDAAHNTAAASVLDSVTGGVLAGNAATLDVSFQAVTNLSFSGTVRNGNSPGSPVTFSHVAIFQDGLDPAVGLICTTVSQFNGSYGCNASLAGRALTSIDLRYEVSGGTGTHPIADPVVALAVPLTPGNAARNNLPRDLVATPTTIIASGHLRGDSGAPISNAFVSFNQESGSVRTDSNGAYTLAVTVNEGSTSFSDTLTATATSGASTTAPAVIASLQARAGNPVTVDLSMSERRFSIHGRVQNTNNADGALANAVVTFSIGGTVVCSATVDGTAGAANDNYFCSQISRFDGNAFTLGWSVSGLFGSTSGTTDVPLAQIPPAGGSKDEKIVITFPVTALDVTGAVTINGAPPGSPVTVAGTNAQQSASVQSDSSGHYELLVNVPAADTGYSLQVVANDGKNSASKLAAGAIAQAGTVVPVQVSLDISSVGGGTAQFAEQVQTSFNTVPTRFAPALDSAGVLYEPSGSGISARTIGPTGTTLLWNGGDSFPGSSPMVIEGAAGAVYYGDFNGRLHKLGSNGVQQWSVRHDDESAQVGFLATNGTLIFALQSDGFDQTTRESTPPHVRALTSDGIEQWSTDLSGSINGIAVSPDGSILAATTDGLWSLRASDGRTRWMLPGWTNTPAFSSDGSTVTVTSAGVNKLDPNGVLFWNAPLDGFDVTAATPPVVDQDGSVVVAFGTSLVRVPADGARATPVDGGLQNGENFANSSLVLGGDGTVYAATWGDSGNSALYACDQTFAQRFRFQPPQGDFRTYQPVVVPGSVYFLGTNGNGNTFLYAVTSGTGAGLSPSSWPQALGENDHHSQAAPPPLPYREVVLQGSVQNANNGGRAPFPLAGAQVTVIAQLDGAAHFQPYLPATADASGAYFLSLLIPQTSALDGSAIFQAYGVSQNAEVDFAAGAAGSSTVVNLDQQLAVTTLELTGQVHIPAEPGATAGVTVDFSSGTWVDDPGVNTVQGAYQTFVLYDASITADTLGATADTGILGVQSQQVDVTLEPGTLNLRQLDFTLTNRPATQVSIPGFDPASNTSFLSALAANPLSDAVYFTVVHNPEVGVVGPAPAFARRDSSKQSLAAHGLAGAARLLKNVVHPDFASFGTTVVSGISADGTTTFETAALSGESPAAVVGGDGNVYLGGNKLIVFDPQLKTIASYDPQVDDPQFSGGGLAPPAILPTSHGALAVSAVLRGDAGTSAVVGVQLDFTTASATRAWVLFSPDAAPWDLPQDQTLPAFGASNVYVPLGAHLLGIDPSASGKLLFDYQANTGSPIFASAAGVWSAAGVESVQFQVPGALTDSVTSAGVERSNWPVTSVVPLVFPSLSVGATTGISYFSDGNGALWAINPDGTCRWRFDSDFVFGSALGSDGTLYITSASTLYAFADSNTGCDASAVPAWRFDLGKQIHFFAGAAVGATKIWVIADDGHAYGVAR
jgi:hypothetical protein